MAHAREVRITITNSTSSTLYVQQAPLQLGEWQSDASPIGQEIDSGQNPTYVNFTTSPFSGVGGSIVLIGTGSGNVTINWSWAAGHDFSAQTSTTIKNVGVSYNSNDQGGSSVLLTVSLTNAS